MDMKKYYTLSAATTAWLMYVHKLYLIEKKNHGTTRYVNLLEKIDDIESVLLNSITIDHHYQIAIVCSANKIDHFLK